MVITPILNHIPRNDIAMAKAVIAMAIGLQH